MSPNIPENEKVKAEADIAAEFAELGKKLRKTVETAWTSQERYKVQREVEDGLVKLRDELNEAIKNARASEAGKKVETEVHKVRVDIESGKVVDDMRSGLIVGLRGLGAALDSLAESFTPAGEAHKVEPPKK